MASMLANPTTALDVIERYRPHIQLPARGKIAALLYVAVALVAFVAACVLPAALRHLDLRIGTSLSLLLLAVCGVSCVAARRSWLPDIIQVLRHDARRPVLYLRTFDNDEIPNTKTELLSFFEGLAFGAPFSMFKKVRWTAGMESRLCGVLRTIGPIIAVARPDEIWNLPTACRLKLDDAHWRDVVGELMAASALIVMDVSASTGLRWEVERAATPANRSKLVLAFATGRPKARRSIYAYNQVCELVEGVFGHRLPDLQGDIAFITFGPDGVPLEHQMTTNRSFAQLMFGRFRLTLLEVLRQMGYRAQLPYGRLIARIGTRLAGVTLVVAAFAFNVLLTQGLREQDQRASQLQRFAEHDKAWRAEFNEAIDGLKSRRYTADYVARLIETRVVPRLRDEQKALAGPSTSISHMNEALRQELNRQVTAHIDALRQLGAGLKNNDAGRVRAAIESGRHADDILNDFLKTRTAELR
jgi:hypothetical protein